MNGHKVNNVQQLHETAFDLYQNVVVNGDASADTILNDLDEGIENLKANWKGKDAGLRIEEVIKVRNAMTEVRNVLANLAVDSSKVATYYREIQNANGAGLEDLTTLNFETKTKLGDYTDTNDTIDINPSAETGKSKIDKVNSSIDSFASMVRSKYDELMQNWTSGTGRDSAQEAFDSFLSNVNRYKEVLSEVSSNITKALQNYKF